jgi:KaiC/GvpD/RAD55 family RecA-like ATPase
MAAFIKHTECSACGSSDGKAIYNDGSWHCFVCRDTSPSEDFKADNGKKPSKVKSTVKEDMEVKPSNKPAITAEENARIKSETSASGKDFRGIRDDIYKMFGVRHAFSEETGEVTEQYYPCTQEGQLSGYKVREVPKNFYSKGRTGADCDLFMQFKFNRGGKYLLITEGEVDSLSAYQMLKDYATSKNSDFETAVVSPTTGAGSKKQIAAQYKFCDTFDNVILCYDMDKAGQEAAQEIIKYLPKGKVRTMQMRFKDANEYLEQGKTKEFISDFYNAKQFVPVGVVGSGSISESMREEFKVPKIPLPPFMHKLQDMMAGGVPLGRILNLGSASGTGKSTIIDEIVYHMLFNSPHKVGIVTLESTTGQYGIKLLSRHIGLKLELKDNDEALDILSSDKVLEKEKELFFNEDGTHRFWLVDDRDGGVDNVKEAIENLVISCGCRVIVLDPVNDCIGSLSNEEQESFYAWQKGMVKSHNCTFYNVMHTRKTSGSQKAGSAGADLHEEDLMGASAAYKSAACNLMFSRNKESEDDVERNTTVMKATKIRWTGKTGIAGKYYYDIEKHTLYDLEDWLNENGTAY